MEIRINNHPTTFNTETLSVSALLTLQKKTEKGIAVAVNQRVIPKTEWSRYYLKENDQVLIITATQGG